MSLSNLPISRKLALAFGLVLVAIAAMGAVIFLNLNALNAAGEVRSVVNQDIRDLDVVELRLARQENSFRGYLVSGDPYYIERLDAHRAAFLAALADLRQDGDPATAQSADAIEAAGEAWHQSVVVDGIRMAADPATRQAVIDMVGPDGAADTYMAAVEEPVEALREASMARLAEARAVQSASARNALIVLFAGLGAALAIAVAAGWILTRGIAGPALNMVGYMRRLMGGDTSFEVPCVARKDEFGEMGRAVVSFRDAAVDKIRVEQEAADQRQVADGERAKNQAMTEAQAREQAAVVTALGEGLDRLSQGDLTYTITTDFPGDYAKLKADFNLAMQQLRDAMTVVVQNVGGIRSGAGEISQAADDLSRRTEQQAASLEETAAALDEITATVNRTASGARQASDTVKAAKGDAESSGLVVREAVQAMGAIEKSAQEINQIIGVIDEIAFQTNLLALNAGVEAARAGEAGRGFAVVASEVRALAQRSAEAAKEIKVLISASTTEVNSGVSLVGQTGDALERIVGRVGEIDALVSEIAASAQEQATGLQQVNTAVNQMDQVTQQNAAMVEQSTAASHSLSQEAEALAASISRFKTGVQAAVSAARAAQPAPAPISAPRPTPAPIPALKTIGSGGAALKIDQAPAEDGWEEF